MRSWGHLSLKVSDSILDRVDLEGYAGSVSIYVISRPDEIPLSGPLVLYLVVYTRTYIFISNGQNAERGRRISSVDGSCHTDIADGV